MKIQTIGKDCRVQIPTQAHEWVIEQNSIRRKSDVRLIPITDVILAILARGLEVGGWEAICLKNAEGYKSLGPRARQPNAKKNVT